MPSTAARRLVAVLLALLAGTIVAAPEVPPVMALTQTVVLVRHAEKSAAGGRDPVLSPLGVGRAAALAEALAGTGIGTILTTPLQRTRLTAEPLARALGLEPQAVPFPKEGGTATHVAAVAAAVRAAPAGTAVLVVGHSNTVPAIVAALGGPALPDLCEDRFDALFVLLPGTPPKLLQARYGAPDGAAGQPCP